MDTFRSYVEKLKARKLKLEKGILKSCADSAFTVAALAKNRVINKRVDDEGNIFGIYSDTYQKKRLKNNLTGDQINFSYTNKMFATLIPRLQKSDGKEIIFVIEPNAANADKLDYNQDRFGNIIGINKEEQKLHIKTLSENITSLIIQ